MDNGWASRGTIPLLTDPVTGDDLTEAQAFALIDSQSGYGGDIAKNAIGGSTGDRPVKNQCADIITAERKDGIAQYCGHDHKYSTIYKPQELPSTLYTIVYSKKIVVRGVRIVQHYNGINCIKVEVDGKSIGNKCLYPIKRGSKQYKEGSVYDIFGYNDLCWVPSPNFLDRPRISYYSGMVNQHFDTDAGIWKTDPDKSSGADKDKLSYCQKWYPSTTSFSDTLNKELISFCAEGQSQCPNPSTRIVYECIGATVNTCTCPNGIPSGWYKADGSSGATLCDINNQIDCSACNDGYIMSAPAASGSVQTCEANTFSDCKLLHLSWY